MAWPGVCMAEKSDPGKRRPAGVKGGSIAITGGVVMRWQREACGVKGVCCDRARCGARDAGA